VLVATDGSPNARAAVAAAVTFPWPRGAQAEGLVARRPETPGGTMRPMLTALDRNAARIADGARRALAERWPEADVVVARKSPVAAILDEARRLRPGAIVVGWRGHGAFRRLLMGSVSRDVVRQASAPVLVVRRAPRDFTSFVLGVDGSRHARRAAELLAALDPPRGGRVTVVRVEEPMAMPPSAGRLPGASAASSASRSRPSTRSASRARSATSIRSRPGWPGAAGACARACAWARRSTNCWARSPPPGPARSSSARAAPAV
jgi:nucleotide-binding universal stress UspA family protein